MTRRLTHPLALIFASAASLFLASLAIAADEPAALTIADLAEYRAALSDKGTGTAERPVAPVGFRDLWDRPATYQGRRVQVEGRVVRRFQQGPFGTFPSLEEVWISSPVGDPFCLVFPAPSAEAAEPGSTAPAPVRFVGTFLKLVEYQGGDGPRLAPLIVGPAPPQAATATATGKGPRSARAPGFHLSRLDWLIGIAAAVVVAAVLARQHLRKPAPLTRNAGPSPDPLFIDADDQEHQSIKNSD